MSQDVLLQRMYDFMRWMLGRTGSYRKEMRTSLGRRTEELMFGIFESMVLAWNTGSTRELKRISVNFDTLKWYVRLAMDMGLITVKQYEFASGMLVEIGRLIGGWLKTQSGQEKKWGGVHD